MDEPEGVRGRRRLRRTRRVLMITAIVVCALAVFGATANAVLSFLDRRGVHPTGKMVSAGSYKLHVDCRGSGSPTVVFEAGSGGTSLDWASVQERVSRTNRTCSYDRAGYAWSDAAPTHTLARMRHDFDVVLRAAGPGPYVLVAHSFGGLLVLDHASRHPKDIAGLVLVDAAERDIYVKMDRVYPQFFRNGSKLAAVTKAASVLTRFGVTRLVRQPASPKTMATSVRRQYRAVGYSPKAYRAFGDDLSAFRTYLDDAEDDPPSVPTAVLSHSDPGTLWQGVPKEGAERLWQDGQRAMAARFGVQVRIVPDTTHFIQVLRPDVVVSAIEDVVRRSEAMQYR